MAIFKQLNSRQQDLIIWIYNECISSNKVTLSNKEIARKVNIPESTVEKYLKLFDDLKLIIRESKKEMDLFQNWRTTSRSIELNPKYFDPQLIMKERVDRTNRFLDSLSYQDITQSIIRQRGLSS